MNPKCSSCNKTVYPVEKLNVLDKYWHKGCFRCVSCNLALNMKNYKGYDKMPYCQAHYPTTKFTAVADTPENLRLKKQSDIISNVKYHKDFEQSKGRMTSVADDPETLRVKKNTKIQSQTTYHGHQEQRLMMEQRRPLNEEEGIRQPSQIVKHAPEPDNYDPIKEIDSVSQPPKKIGSIEHYNPLGDADSYRSSRKEPPVIQPPPQGSYSYRPQSYEAPTPYRPPASQQPTYPVPQPVAQPVYNPPPPVTAQPPPPVPQPQGDCYQALYDYTAADDDEVTFQENDILINCESIDDGWMTGTNQRTGETGMLPSNYVEKI